MHALRVDTIAFAHPGLGPWHHIVAGGLRELRGRFRTARARRVRDELEQVLGLRLQLVGMLQRRTRQDAHVVQSQVDTWLSRNISFGGALSLVAGATPSPYGEHP